MNCLICYKQTNKDLCDEHFKRYMWDSTVQGYRLKKKNNGSRYTTDNYHNNEITLTKILESFFGLKDIITGYRPLWAVSDKKVLFEYDIYIKSLNLLVEYNGQQHYKFVSFFYKDKKAFFERKRKDQIKKVLAKENKFKLIVFKYNEPLFEDYVINKIKRRIK